LATTDWSVNAVSSAFIGAAQQSLITEPVCRFLELLQYSKPPL
jgi:hypothetical protein